MVKAAGFPIKENTRNGIKHLKVSIIDSVMFVSCSNWHDIGKSNISYENKILYYRKEILNTNRLIAENRFSKARGQHRKMAGQS